MKFTSPLAFIFFFTFVSHSKAQNELEEVKQAEFRRNYTACVNGYSCNKSLLVGSQSEEVKQPVLRLVSFFPAGKSPSLICL